MRKNFFQSWKTVLALTACVSLGIAQQNQNRPAQGNGEVQILHGRGPIYMLVGAGGNITVSVGPDGVLMVDTGLANMTDKVLAAVRQLQRELATNGLTDLHWGSETRSAVRTISDTNAPVKPIRYIINTHVHPDHIAGNEKLA